MEIVSDSSDPLCRGKCLQCHTLLQAHMSELTLEQPFHVKERRIPSAQEAFAPNLYTGKCITCGATVYFTEIDK